LGKAALDVRLDKVMWACGIGPCTSTTKQKFHISRKWIFCFSSISTCFVFVLFCKFYFCFHIFILLPFFHRKVTNFQLHFDPYLEVRSRPPSSLYIDRTRLRYPCHGQIWLTGRPYEKAGDESDDAAGRVSRSYALHLVYYSTPTRFRCAPWRTIPWSSYRCNDKIFMKKNAVN
jgi:hypothetical protein